MRCLVYKVLMALQKVFANEENRLILFLWLGGLFAPFFMWFLIPHCVKQLKRLPIGDEMVPYGMVLMVMGFSLTLWGGLVAIVIEMKM